MSADSNSSPERDGDASLGAAFVVGGRETGELIRSIAWEATRLGRAGGWPQSLRTAIGICVTSRFPIAVYWGPEYVMLYNDDLIPMVGANKHPRAMGRPAFEVLPEIRPIIEPLLERVRSTGEAIWSEDLMLPLFRSEGQTESYFTFNYSPIHDESGAVGGVFCAVLETTDKVVEERRLRLLNSLAEVTGAGTPRDACTLAASHLSRASSDLPFALFYLLDDTSARLELASTANVDAGSRYAPTSITVGDLSTWPFGISETSEPTEIALLDGPSGARGAVVLPIERAGGGAPHGFVVAGLSPLLPSSASYGRFHTLLAASISQGVSHAAAYEVERRRAEELLKLDRAKTTFFSNVSHEFRTPLTLMLAPLQDMASSPVGAVVDHAEVDLLHRNALRLLKLVNSLLEFSRIEAGRLEATYAPVDLATLTADLASIFRAAIERTGVRFEVDCAPLPRAVHVDRDMWEKIVLNLLSNALKYTFEGTIAVRVRPDADAVILEVTDTGVGIAEGELPRLFERFHRIEGGRARSHEGSGIGLALIQELVRLHGGTIHATSEPGAGTTFVVRIPFGTAHLDPNLLGTSPDPLARNSDVEAFVREAARWQADRDDESARVGAPLHPGPRERLLFADDNADMREYVSRLLSERWDVRTVGDGAEALAAIRSDPPDLVLCDVMMPGLDGFALVRTLRADEALRTIPIILLSARAGAEESARGLTYGANDYIAKPFSARDLVVRIASNLAAVRAVRQMAQRERVQRESFYRHFMQAPFPICILRGPDHCIELANPPILRAWGKTEAIVGSKLADAVPELVGQPFLGYLDAVYRTGAAYEGRAELARLPSGANGETEDVYYHFVHAPLRGQDDTIDGVLVSAFDVTDVVHARQESETARREAEAAANAQRAVLEFQERFVAVLGHDLRNPLSAISMAAGLLTQLAEVEKNPTTKRIVGRLTSSARRMATMVEQIMDLSRSRLAGGFDLTPAPVDLSVVLGSVADELRTTHTRATIDIRGPSVVGTWDRGSLEQVFSNLIGNAIHHGDESAPITVLVEHREDTDAVQVRVHNEGPPIPESIRATLFDPFRRGERSSRDAKTQGLGLGLYISRELAVAHGGDISVESDESKGTTFCVAFPRITRATDEGDRT